MISSSRNDYVRVGCSTCLDDAMVNVQTLNSSVQSGSGSSVRQGCRPCRLGRNSRHQAPHSSCKAETPCCASSCFVSFNPLLYLIFVIHHGAFATLWALHSPRRGLHLHALVAQLPIRATWRRAHKRQPTPAEPATTEKSKVQIL